MVDEPLHDLQQVLLILGPETSEEFRRPLQVRIECVTASSTPALGQLDDGRTAVVWMRLSSDQAIGLQAVDELRHIARGYAEVSSQLGHDLRATELERAEKAQPPQRYSLVADTRLHPLNEAGSEATEGARKLDRQIVVFSPGGTLGVA